MASLRESIKRINRNSRERFVEAFDTIRVHYVEIFKVLFGGGRADLVLEEGEDVLECGIEMIAPTTLTARRDISFNESELLAKESEEALLYRDMQSDLVRQMVTRLQGMRVDANPR